MHDLRLLLLAAAGWAAALAVLLLPPATAFGLLAAATVVLGLVAVHDQRRTGGSAWAGWCAVALVVWAVAGACAGHLHALASSPLAELGRERAVVRVEAVVVSDPRTVQGRFAESVVLLATVERVEGRGRAWTARTPVLVVADPDWRTARLGERVRATARTGPGEGDVAAVLRPLGAPEVVESPDAWWDGAAAVRASVREVVAGRGEHERELMPAVVDGDDSGLDPAMADQFRATGLTHLLAVSGTNLTIVVGALLLVARWAGVRGRWAWAVGAMGVLGFVLLARTEPSVVRAAAMGSAALVGMGTNGRSRGVRCLGAAVLGLLLVDPWLALAPGFALSALATGGILLLAPPWRDALARWLPRWAAEAVSVPLAAQVACTPVVAALSGEVSLVAVAANLLVAPVVAPATVLGLAGGLVGLAWTPAGVVVAAPGAWCLTWVVTVAEAGAALPQAAVGWGTSAWWVAGLTALCVATSLGMPWLLRRRGPTLAVCLVLVVAVVMVPPTPGWPPRGWVALMCDVGQGDALLLRAGEGRAVLVDAGPDSALVDRCLERAGADDLPLVVLTHFHADHVDGLAGALRGRRVGTVVGSPLALPAAGAAAVDAALGRPVGGVAAGQTVRVGDVGLTVLWPVPEAPGTGTRPAPGADEEQANDASVVLLAEVRGVRLLLTGDVEPPAQAGLRRSVGALAVDVLKVPHHGSRHQDLGWLTSLGSAVALVGVGADNTYGHPSADVLTALEDAGTVVGRTDLHGDLAVVRTSDGVRVLRRGPLGARDVGGDG